MSNCKNFEKKSKAKTVSKEGISGRCENDDESEGDDPFANCLFTIFLSFNIVSFSRGKTHSEPFKCVRLDGEE